ncbi:MAG: hypothetical protein VKL58_08665 [Cyanobacteriota bacterium]|nr:hypothetical protein [Cyanobacteriota bacterium]
MRPPEAGLRRIGPLFLWGASFLLAVLLWGAPPAGAAPGLCVGPVCGEGFDRSGTYPWQMRMRVQDPWGHRERLLVDCRDGSISPLLGPVERGYASALGRRACRQAPIDPRAEGSPPPPLSAQP